MATLDVVDLALGGVLVVDDVATLRRRRVLSFALVALLLVSLIAGVATLLGENQESTAMVDGQPPSTEWRPYSVVAPIDTGINVYHDHFRTEEVYPDWLLEGLGVTKTCEPTFEGTWEERYQADKETCWDTITTSDIVYFKGTKILGTSPDGGTDIHILDDPSDGHGTAVTGAVLDANPDAVIFFVEGFSTEAVLAAGNQPLVDIVTTSFGAIGSLPVPGIETGTHQTVVVNNKIHTCC